MVNIYSIFDEDKVLDHLPPYLRMDISYYVAKKAFQDLDFFSMLTPMDRGSIALKMKSISCNQGYKLFQAGDLAQQLYIQRTGNSNKIFEKDGLTVNWPLQRGSVIGENSIIEKLRMSTLVCETFCEFYVIEISDIKETLMLHHGDKWYKRYKEMKKLLRRTIKQQKSRVCKLLAKKEDFHMNDMHMSVAFKDEGYVEGNANNETIQNPNGSMLEIAKMIKGDQNVEKKMNSHIELGSPKDKKKRITLTNPFKNMLNRTASQYRNDKITRGNSNKDRQVTITGTAKNGLIKDWKEVEDEIVTDESGNSTSYNTDSSDNDDSSSDHGDKMVTGFHKKKVKRPRGPSDAKKRFVKHAKKRVRGQSDALKSKTRYHTQVNSVTVENENEKEEAGIEIAPVKEEKHYHLEINSPIKENDEAEIDIDDVEKNSNAE